VAALAFVAKPTRRRACTGSGPGDSRAGKRTPPGPFRGHHNAERRLRRKKFSRCW